MPSALETVFLKGSKSESSIIRELHDRYPMNLRAHEVDYEKHSELTERMRLRRAKSALEAAGIKVSGAELAHSCSDYQVAFRGNFNQHGNLKGQPGVGINPEGGAGDKEREDLLQITQMVLHQWGFAAVVNRSDELLVFKQGIARDQVDWVALGLGARGAEGWTPREAEKWIARNEEFADISILESWAGTGIDLEEALEWVAVRTVSYRGEPETAWRSGHAVAAWKSAGFDVAGASQWAKLYYRMADYSYAKPWIDSGMDPEEAQQWLTLVAQSGYGGGFAMADSLRSAGLKPRQAMELGRAGLNDRHIANLVDWAKAEKMSMSRLVTWCKLAPLMGSPLHFKYWYAKGLTPEEARAWCEVGVKWGRHNPFHQPDRIDEWIDAGFGPEDAKPWVELNSDFGHYHVASRWMTLGLTPADAKPWAEIARNHYSGRELLNPTAVISWQEAHPSLISPQAVEKTLRSGISLNQAKTLIDILGE